MKHPILFLLGLFLSTNIVIAQGITKSKQNAENNQRTLLLQAFKSNNQTAYKQVSDLNNNLESILFQSYYDEKWNSNSRFLFTYDTPNNSYESLNQFFSSDVWIDFFKMMNVFNDNDLPLEFRDYDSNGFGFTETSVTKYYYAQDNKIDSVTYTENDEGVIYKDISTFNYVTADSILMQEASYVDGVYDTTYSGSIVYRDGNLIITYDDERDTYYNIDFNNFIRNTSIFSVFDSYLFEVKDENQQWIPLDKTIYVKEHGKVVSGETSEYIDGKWVLESKQEFQYENDQLIAVIDSSFYDEYVDIYRQLYSYNENVSNEEEIDRVNFSLHQNYPNPFNPVTTIPYSLNSTQHVSLDVYNMLGQKVAQLVNGIQSAGNYSISFDATNLTSGIYLYRLQSGSQSSTRKLLLIK